MPASCEKIADELIDTSRSMPQFARFPGILEF
jgi:hypothetical protein